jgi:hypothetical protein
MATRSTIGHVHGAQAISLPFRNAVRPQETLAWSAFPKPLLRRTDGGLRRCSRRGLGGGVREGSTGYGLTVMPIGESGCARHAHGRAALGPINGTLADVVDVPVAMRGPPSEGTRRYESHHVTRVRSVLRMAAMSHPCCSHAAILLEPYSSTGLRCDTAHVADTNGTTCDRANAHCPEWAFPHCRGGGAAAKWRLWRWSSIFRCTMRDAVAKWRCRGGAN